MGNSLGSAAPAAPAPPAVAPPPVAPPLVLREQGGADGSAAWRIDPDQLEVQCEDCVCQLCFGVMVVPTSGCPQGHTFCGRCYDEALLNRLECPTCRRPTDQNTLVFNRHLQGMISLLHTACENEAEGNLAKRAKLVPAASMSVGELGTELLQRGLDSTGNKPELVARLEEDRKEGVGCRWRGYVGQLAGHLGECGFAPKKCPNEGCTESPLRKDLPAHEATMCEHRAVKCRHCSKEMIGRSLADHEGGCPSAMIECPAEGCSGQFRRSAMNLHRAECQHEEVTCPCPGCDKRLLRKDIIQHVGNRHRQEAGELLVSFSRKIAVLEGKVAELESELEGKVAELESEQRLAAASTTSSVFNWRAEGWGGSRFESETHEFADGIAGQCVLAFSSKPQHSHFIGFNVQGRDKCRVHATLSLLDKHDKILRQVHETGTAEAPEEFDFTASTYKGRYFTPTAAEKAQSVRADGSIRLRAEVRLFLD